ncbi:coatomer subunit beta-like protein [Medicago truncatula]|uniref:Coatomer subunit beta-like protein n=1 Tax=Medicago truncatula TaxID=3880 RepID=G7IYI8_MEDTR|nr:coatomer subunit beta-like protein [Medicago truncatula]
MGYSSQILQLEQGLSLKGTLMEHKNLQLAAVVKLSFGYLYFDNDFFTYKSSCMKSMSPLSMKSLLNANSPLGKFQLKMIFMTESSFALKLLHNTGDEIRKGCLQSCRQNIMKMIADKQRHKTKEIKEKACISHVQLDDLKEKGEIVLDENIIVIIFCNEVISNGK